MGYPKMVRAGVLNLFAFATTSIFFQIFFSKFFFKIFFKFLFKFFFQNFFQVFFKFFSNFFFQISLTQECNEKEGFDADPRGEPKAIGHKIFSDPKKGRDPPV